MEGRTHAGLRTKLKKSTYKIDRDNIKKIVKDVNFVEIYINTSVEECEENPDAGFHVNCTLAANVATICSEKGIKLIHVSTDHLFDGEKRYLTESDPVCPVNTYGKTKLAGEQAVSEIYPEALIVRTNFFGWGGPYKHSFSDWIIQSLRNNCFAYSNHLFIDVGIASY